MENYIKIIIVGIIGLFISCSPIKYIPVETITETTTTLHDTIIKTKLVPYSDSIITKDTISFLSNDYAKSMASYSEGYLTHTLSITPSDIEVKVSFPTITKKISSEVPLLVEKSLSLWQKIKLQLGGYSFVCLLLLLGYVIITILK